MCRKPDRQGWLKFQRYIEPSLTVGLLTRSLNWYYFV
jgi:hypothetical protein